MFNRPQAHDASVSLWGLDVEQQLQLVRQSAMNAYAVQQFENSGVKHTGQKRRLAEMALDEWTSHDLHYYSCVSMTDEGRVIMGAGRVRSVVATQTMYDEAKAKMSEEIGHALDCFSAPVATLFVRRHGAKSWEMVLWALGSQGQGDEETAREIAYVERLVEQCDVAEHTWVIGRKLLDHAYDAPRIFVCEGELVEQIEDKDVRSTMKQFEADSSRAASVLVQITKQRYPIKKMSVAEDLLSSSF